MATTATSSLPLHCSVCPKKPHFSDVSHLLTHIASKGHLSHYYKLKVRSTQDQDARNDIDDYDDWYNVWNIEDLMSARLRDKERRRPRARAQASATSKPPAKKSKKANAVPVVDPDLPAFPPLATMQPPDLMSSFDTPQPSLPKRPKSYLWSTQRPTSFMAIPVESSSPAPDEPAVPSSQNDTIADANEEDLTIVDEAARLKGVFWPGMDIFDSATMDMKRKRNQKKDVSVLENLEQNSLIVEPTEVIYYSLGDLKKQRTITGKVASSSSPFSGPMPLPAKRKLATRQPLAEKSVNLHSTLQSVRGVQHNKSSHGPGVLHSTAVSDRRLSLRQDDQENDHIKTEKGLGMCWLTAGFRPATQQRPFDLFQQSSFAGVGTYQCNTSTAQSSGTTYAPYDSSQQNDQPDFFGPAGYDLAAFLSHNLDEDTKQEESGLPLYTGFHTIVDSKPAAGNTDNDHKGNGVGTRFPNTYSAPLYETAFDFEDSSLRLENNRPIFSDESS